jgi:hypothetical protein
MRIAIRLKGGERNLLSSAGKDEQEGNHLLGEHKIYNQKNTPL